MSRYIDADEILYGLFQNEEEPYCRGWNDALRAAADTATADVAEVKRGRWIDDYDVHIGYMPRCSVCGKKILYAVSFDLTGQKYQMNYCPNCGSKMDEVEDETKL